MLKESNDGGEKGQRTTQEKRARVGVACLAICGLRSSIRLHRVMKNIFWRLWDVVLLRPRSDVMHSDSLINPLCRKSYASHSTCPEPRQARSLVEGSQPGREISTYNAKRLGMGLTCCSISLTLNSCPLNVL